MPDDIIRVAQLGNSHSKAIADALVGFQSDKTKISSFPIFRRWRVDLPASEGAARALVIEPKHQVDTPIALDTFDLYVVSAAGLLAGRNRHLMNGTHPLASVRCAHWAVSNGAIPEYMRIVSRAAFEEMVYGWVAVHGIAQLVRFLAQEADKKVIWVSWPVPSRSMLTDAGWLLNIWYGVGMPQVWREFRAAEQRAAQRLAGEYGKNVILLPTPRSEMEAEGFMDEALAAADPFHGNEKYGELVVEQLLPFFNGTAASSR